ncbi:MAG TPA: hypothetical protein VFI68_02705 [Anaerolineales bacterium]|nr:hypothetical protein [Anaerolineales bacterium]
MKKHLFLFWTYSLFLVLFASCSRNAALDPEEQLRISVASTIAAIPTVTPFPQPTSYPSPTPFNLLGLFCEYQFCIGHPIDMAFFDVSAQQNPAAPSSYGQGLIAAFNGNLFIQVIWQLAPGAADPEFVLDLILDDAADVREGTLEVKLVRNMNVMYTTITSIATPVLPFGGSGAWTCGDRVFGWKAYTPQAETANPLFEEALARFTCG